MDDEKIKRLLEIVAEQLQSDKDNLTAAVDIVVDFSIENSISPEILLSFVPSFGSNGFYEAAYALSKAAASLSTGHTQANAYYNAGIALIFLGRTDEAEAQYKLALAADPNHVNTHTNYGLLLKQSGRTDEAEAQYKLALAADPNDVTLVIG
jgi:tetratricopeptide (TPR) repeat protein